MPRPQKDQRFSTPDTTLAPVADPDDAIHSALAEIGDTEGSVRVYRKRLGARPAHLHTYPASEFSVEAVGRDWGGGDYFAQVCSNDAGKRIVGSGEFSIDPSVRPTRRIAPPVQPLGAFPEQADPLAALSAKVDRLASLIGGDVQQQPAAPRDDRPSWRDMIELATRGPAQSQGASLAEMAKFLEIMRPKSSVEELLSSLTLIKKLERSPIAAAASDDGGSGFDLGAIVNSPLATAIVGKLLADQPTPKPAASVTTPTPAALPAAPAPTPPAAPTPTPQPAAPQVPAAELPADIAGFLPAIADQLVEQLQANPNATGADIADQFDETFPATQLAEMFETIPEGVFALSLVKANPKLQPVALKLILAEGRLREMAEADDEDEADAAPIEPVPSSSPLPPPAAPEPAPPTPPPAKKKAKKT